MHAISDMVDNGTLRAWTSAIPVVRAAVLALHAAKVTCELDSCKVLY